MSDLAGMIPTEVLKHPVNTEILEEMGKAGLSPDDQQLLTTLIDNVAESCSTIGMLAIHVTRQLDQVAYNKEKVEPIHLLDEVLYDRCRMTAFDALFTSQLLLTSLPEECLEARMWLCQKAQGSQIAFINFESARKAIINHLAPTN